MRPFECCRHLPLQPHGEMSHHLRAEIFLAFEVVVEGAFGYTHPIEDLLQAGPVVAVLDHDRHTFVEQPGPELIVFRSRHGNSIRPVVYNVKPFSPTHPQCDEETWLEVLSDGLA